MCCYKLLVIIFTFLHCVNRCYAENMDTNSGLQQQLNEPGQQQQQQQQQQQSVRIGNARSPDMKTVSRKDQTTSGQTGAKFQPPTKLNATNLVQNITLTANNTHNTASKTRNNSTNIVRGGSVETVTNPRRNSQGFGRSKTASIVTAEEMTMKSSVPTTTATSATRTTPKAIMKATTKGETTDLRRKTTATRTKPSPDVSKQGNDPPKIKISSSNEVKPKMKEEPNPKPLTVHDLMNHVFGNGSRTKFQNHDNEFPPNFLRNFFNNKSSTLTDADIEYKKTSSSKDSEETRPNLRITTHEENSSETLTGYFQFGRQFLRTRSRDAVWGMLSMLLIVGGSIVCILWTRMWKNRHFDWINVQEPLPPVKVSMREVVLTRAKYLPKQRSKWHRGKKYISFRNESDADRSESESDGEFVVIDVGRDIID